MTRDELHRASCDTVWHQGSRSPLRMICQSEANLGFPPLATPLRPKIATSMTSSWMIDHSRPKCPSVMMRISLTSLPVQMYALNARLTVLGRTAVLNAHLNAINYRATMECCMPMAQCPHWPWFVTSSHAKLFIFHEICSFRRDCSVLWLCYFTNPNQIDDARSYYCFPSINQQVSPEKSAKIRKRLKPVDPCTLFCHLPLKLIHWSCCFAAFFWFNDTRSDCPFCVGLCRHVQPMGSAVVKGQALTARMSTSSHWTPVARRTFDAAA